VAYPEKSQSVEADGFPEPYPVFGRSSDGQTVYIQAPNDGTFEPGPSSLRLRLANAQSFTFPYAFIAWYPPKGGLPGGLAVTAPEVLNVLALPTEYNSTNTDAKSAGRVCIIQRARPMLVLSTG
jgi:hypothetical protein